MATAGTPFSVSSPLTLALAFSATPVFNAALVGQHGTFTLTLTGNVTSSTLVNGFVGQVVNFVISQDATGGRTVVWPTNAGGIPNVLAAASSVTRFSLQWDGTAWQGYGPLQIQQIAAYSNATTAFTSIPEFGFTVAANRNYSMLLHLHWSTGNTAAAPTYQLTGPSSPTAVTFSMYTPTTVSAIASPAGSVAASFANSIVNPATVTISTAFTDVVFIGVQNGANAGTVQLQMKSTSAAGTVTYSPGSGGILICS